MWWDKDIWEERRMAPQHPSCQIPRPAPRRACGVLGTSSIR